MKRIVFFILSLFLVTGCIPQPKALIERDTVELNTTVFNRSFKEKLPVVKKMPFGDIAILGATVASDTKGDRLSVKANITFKNFQIPEGLGGVVEFDAGLRYDPYAKNLYLDDMKPVAVNFGNSTLVKYIPNTTRRSIASIVGGELTLIPLAQVTTVKGALTVEKIEVDNGSVEIDFGK
jgi:hypothetical protein